MSIALGIFGVIAAIAVVVFIIIEAREGLE